MLLSETGPLAETDCMLPRHLVKGRRQVEGPAVTKNAKSTGTHKLSGNGSGAEANSFGIPVWDSRARSQSGAEAERKLSKKAFQRISELFGRSHQLYPHNGSKTEAGRKQNGSKIQMSVGM